MMNLNNGNDHWIGLNGVESRFVDMQIEWGRSLEKFPPTCECCQLANITPDGSWSWCEGCEEWVGGCLNCVDTDYFEPNDEWDACQLSW